MYMIVCLPLFVLGVGCGASVSTLVLHGGCRGCRDRAGSREEGVETEQSDAVVSLNPLLNSEARNPLTGWTYTSQPESPATCGMFVTNIIRKYGRPKAANSVQPAKEKVKFEFSDDDDKRVWTLQ